MIKRNVKSWGQKFENAGIKINVLIPKEETGCLEIIQENFYPGLEDSVKIHEDKEEIYFITKGIGVVKINEEQDSVKEGDLIIIPRNSKHSTKNNGKGELIYLCISIFSKCCP